LTGDNAVELIGELGVEQERFAVLVNFASVFEHNAKNAVASVTRSGEGNFGLALVTIGESILVRGPNTDGRITVSIVKVESGGFYEQTGNTGSIKREKVDFLVGTNVAEREQ
jgi:hypothetical protein